MDKSIEEIIVYWRKALASGYYDSRLNASETSKLISEIERLKKDLKKYGMHKTGCSIGWGVDGECNCGFEQALKEK